MLMVWLPMTTTWVSEGYIDYAAFGIAEGDLRSVRALGGIWRAALDKVAAGFGNPVLLEEFVKRSGELPDALGDIQWQRQWMSAWHKLSGRGFSMADMFGFFNRAVAVAEADLFGNQAQVGRLQLDLFGMFRRCVVAAISCA